MWIEEKYGNNNNISLADAERTARNWHSSLIKVHLTNNKIKDNSRLDSSDSSVAQNKNTLSGVLLEATLGILEKLIGIARVYF